MTNSRLWDIDNHAVIPYDCDIDDIMLYFYTFILFKDSIIERNKL